MKTCFWCGKNTVTLDLPDNATIYTSSYPEITQPPGALISEALSNPIGAPPLKAALKQRRDGEVVIVVSDITRPIPYATILPVLLQQIESAGVGRDSIVILVATGMHRPSTSAEHREMFGEGVVRNYTIVDHQADDADSLVELPGTSWSGNKAQLNARYVNAGFRIITGLVEPHFMAGFSGGRKAVCPGLASLATVCRFHGYDFLADPRACNGVLEDNPCHCESLSVAKLAGVEFSLNVVLNDDRKVVRAYAGELEAAHGAACDFVRHCACPQIDTPADVVLTSCGGYPLDTTFYQCVKGMVSCLPAVKPGGVLIAFGSCSEGIGGPEYADIMRQYAGRWEEFLRVIRDPARFVKDQWEFQMQCRALAKVGSENLHFVTDGLGLPDLDALSLVAHHAERGTVECVLQEMVNNTVQDGDRLAVFPEGPYCAPVEKL